MTTHLATATPIDAHPLRHLFPVTEEMIYLNHAACSPLCQPAVAAVEGYLRAQSHYGMMADMQHFPRIESAREKLATLINASPNDLAFLPNTSTAISTVAHGIHWRAGDNVVTTDGQFPANIYPWLGLAVDGVETRLVPRDGAGVDLQRIADAMDERTRLVAVSWVEFNSGYRYDLTALAELCHSRGALLLVDVIQGLGALTLDVAATGVDFVCGALHKWLLGPAGVGILYIRPGLLDELRPRWANWLSVVDPNNNLLYGQPWKPSARRFEPSTPFTMALIATDAVLDVIVQADPAEIQRRVLANAQLLADRLLEHGYTVVGPTDPVGSGVVCFLPRDEAPEDVVVRLEAHKISIAARVGVVRVAPHFYNVSEEIEALFAPGLLG